MTKIKYLKLISAGYMEIVSANGTGFSCGNCKFLRGQFCRHPELLTSVNPVKGCCNHYSGPEDELIFPIDGDYE